MTDERVVETSTFNIDNPRMRSHLVSGTIILVSFAWFVVSLAFVAFGLYFRRSVWPGDAKLFGLVAFTLAPLYFAFVLGLSGFRTIKSSFSRLRKVPGASLFRARFAQSFVSYESDAGVKAQIPYSLLNKLAPESTGILVKLEMNRLIWVPRESFASKEDFDLASKWCLEAQLAKNNSERGRSTA